MSDYLLISDAAKEVEVESHVLRYWEEELELPIRRNELGHRYYTKEDVERFRRIKNLKERGFQLKAIKGILQRGNLEMVDQEGWFWGREGALNNKNELNSEKAALSGQGQEAGLEQNVQSVIEEHTGIVERPGMAIEILEIRDLEAEVKQQKSEEGCSGGRNKGEQYEGVQKRDEWEEGRRKEGQGTNNRKGDEQEGEEYEEGELMEKREKRQEGDKQDSEKKNEKVQIEVGQIEDIRQLREKTVWADEKVKKIQILLQQIIQETVRESGEEYSRMIKDSVLKELDYQFRLQEERLEEREQRQVKRTEEYYRRMDELLREKSGRDIKKAFPWGNALLVRIMGRR